MFKGIQSDESQTGIIQRASPPEAQNQVSSLQKRTEGQDMLRRILIVEDDLSLANLEVEVLAAHGYAVTQVHDGEQALTSLRQSTPDLVVLDFELPGNLTGMDILQVLRHNTGIPVLFTSSEETTLRRYMRASGESRATLDHLSKPYSMHALLVRVQRMLTIAPR
ncbi:MAG TPA: response regulator [Ktedonobacteraceae bacterium]|nr:response regulator [Ktedonobacteraceae bacterium]